MTLNIRLRSVFSPYSTNSLQTSSQTQQRTGTAEKCFLPSSSGGGKDAGVRECARPMEEKTSYQLERSRENAHQHRAEEIWVYSTEIFKNISDHLYVILKKTKTKKPKNPNCLPCQIISLFCRLKTIP